MTRKEGRREGGREGGVRTGERANRKEGGTHHFDVLVGGKSDSDKVAVGVHVSTVHLLVGGLGGGDVGILHQGLGERGSEGGREERGVE